VIITRTSTRTISSKSDDKPTIRDIHKKRKDKIYLGVQHDGDNIAIGVLKMLSGNSLMGKCAKW
jgi:hypothetical protein